MLRRSQRVSLKDDEPESDDKWRAEVEAVAAAQRAERRNQEALRAEFLSAVIASEDAGYTEDEPKSRWSGLLNPMRLGLMLVAVVAGGGAAYLATKGDQPAQVAAAPVVAPVAVPMPTAAPAPKIIEEPKVQVLVAKVAIAPGTAVTADMMEWQAWPEKTARPEYLTQAAAPGAMDELAGKQARAEILPGEPIRREKFAAGGAGYLSAVLDSGMRGVSVQVAAESASGGFIMPGDHVDVVMTRGTPDGEQRSDTILSNVTVLAINADLGAKAPEAAKAEVGAEAKDKDGKQRVTGFENLAIATLELDPTQAEIIINGTMAGKLALVLRPTADSNDDSSARQEAANQHIRMTSKFWQD